MRVRKKKEKEKKTTKRKKKEKEEEKGRGAATKPSSRDTPGSVPGYWTQAHQGKGEREEEGEENKVPTGPNQPTLRQLRSRSGIEPAWNSKIRQVLANNFGLSLLLSAPDTYVSGQGR